LKIGIRNGSLAMTALPAIEAAAKLGFATVELDIPADYTETLIWQADGRRQLTEAAAAAGCEIASLCVGALWQISPASADADIRAEAAELISAAAAIAAELGSQWILLPVTPGSEDQDHEEGVARWIEEIANVAPVAGDLGVRYCLENVGRGCGKSAYDLLRLIKGINSPAVGVYYDIGNALAFGNDAVTEINELAGVLDIVHVKEREGDLLGQGIVPIADDIKALLEIGYDGYLILETGPTDDPMIAGAYNLGYLQSVLDHTEQEE